MTLPVASGRAYFLQYQVDWLRDTSLLKIAEKSRRIGWTYVQSYEDTLDAARAEGGMNVYFSSADLTAAKEYIDYVAMWAELLGRASEYLGELVLQGEGEKAVKAYVVEFASGHRIHALSSNPKNFRSKGGKIVLDEFAFHDDPDEMWKAAAPAVTWGFPLRVFSSHNGKGTRFYRMAEEAKRGNGWSHHKCTIEDAIRDGIVQKIKRLDRPATEQEKDEFRASIKAAAGDEETYEQEYMCNPQDGSTSYIPHGLLEANIHPSVPMPLVLTGEQLHLTPLALYRPAPEFHQEGGKLSLGVDIGRKRDLTVLWLLEEVKGVKWTRLIVELHVVQFRYQFRWLQTLLPLVERAEIDETGIGAQLAEDAQLDFGEFKVQKVPFTLEAKKDLSVGLKRDMEDQALRLPDSEIIRADVRKIRRITTPSGNIVFQGERDKDGHADRYWALALARRAAATKTAGGLITL